MSNYIGLKQILLEHYNIGDCCKSVDETIFNVTSTSGQINDVNDIKIDEPNITPLNGKTIPEVYDIVRNGAIEDKCYLWNTIQKNILDKNFNFKEGVKNEFIKIQKKICPEKTEDDDTVAGSVVALADECSDKYFKFTDELGNKTCLGNWKAVLDLVKGNERCYDSIKKTVKVPATPSRAPHYTKRTFYRVFKDCVDSDKEYKLKYVTPRDEDRKQTQTTPPTRIPPSSTPRQRSSGAQLSVKPEENTTVKPTPTFTNDEQYILDLFKD